MSPARRRPLPPRCPTVVLGLLLVAALLPAAAASLETQTSATAVTAGVDVRVADFPATTSVDRVDLWLPTSTTPGRDTTQGVIFLEWDDNGSWERVELTRVGGGTLVRGDLDGDGGYDGTGAVSNGSAQLVLEFDAVRTEEIRIFCYGGLLGAGGAVDASTALVEIEVYHDFPGSSFPQAPTSSTTPQVHATHLRRAFGTTYGAAANLTGTPNRWNQDGPPGHVQGIGFAGRWQDETSGLVYMRNRYHDPSTGRFTQRDPILHGGGVNMYAYAGGNPVSNRDPMGLDYTYTNAEGEAFWVLQKKPGFWGGFISSRNAPVTAIYKVGTSDGGTVTLSPTFGGGTMSRGAFRAVGKNFRAEHGDISGDHASVQISTITAALQHGVTATSVKLLPPSLRMDAERFPGSAIVAGEVITAPFPAGKVAGPIARRLGPAFRWVKGLFRQSDDILPQADKALGATWRFIKWGGGQLGRPFKWAWGKFFGKGGDATRGGGVTRTFQNQLPGQLGHELAAAAGVGARALRYGDEAFEAAVNEGTIKWVVTESGELLIVPHSIRGVEISHAFLSGGERVLAAGQADIAAAAGQFVGIQIRPHSGHFLNGASAADSVLSLQRGREAFEKIGIIFGE